MRLEESWGLLGMSYKLEDICDYVKEKIDISLIDENTYISTENMLPDKGGITEASSLPSADKTQAFKSGDVLVSNIRPYFKKIWYSTFDGGCSNDVLVFRAKEGVSKRFLYYVLADDTFFSYSMSTAKGTKMPRGDKKALMKYDVPNISYEEQVKIASVLDVIDKKIIVNKEINDNLEQQAVLLMRSWFSDFSQSQNVDRQDSEFGEIPSNFTVVKVGSIPMLVTDYVANGSFASLKENVTLYQEPNYAYFVRNTDLKSGSFGVYVDQHSYEFLSKSTLYGGEIIISNVGDVGSVFLCPKLDGPMTLGNNIIMLRPENDVLRYYLYIWFKHLQGQALIQGIKGGSAQPKFNKTDFKNTSLLLPPLDLLSRFHETVAPMFDAISQNQAENKRLSDLRDTLLPQLMSGELNVSDIDI